MGAIRGPKGKRERALGENLLLKGQRSLSPKAAVNRRPYRPGAHGKSRQRALSDFGRQVREKQKFKLSYGLDERNLRELMRRARGMSGSIETRIMELLESRIDNVVYRMGFAPSRSAARKLVVDGHFFVNGNRIRSPGFTVHPNDVVRVRAASVQKGAFRGLKETLEGYEVPSWLAVDIRKLEGRVLSAPRDIASPFEINLLVESFSK
jgi:small subunit ribosomal protein S4